MSTALKTARSEDAPTYLVTPQADSDVATADYIRLYFNPLWNGATEAEADKLLQHFYVPLPKSVARVGA